MAGRLFTIIITLFLTLLVSGPIIKANTISNFNIKDSLESELFESRDLIKEIKNNIKEFPNYREDRLVIKFKNENNFRTIGVSKGIKIAEAINSLKSNPQVEYVEPDYYAYAQFVPNDPYYPYQWNFNNNVYGGINLADAWDFAQGQNVIIAIIDTGVAYEDYNSFKKAPDLSDTQFVPGYDFINNDSHPNDDNGHGTHVAGTIAQSTNNKIGVAGIAYKAQIMPIKALDKNGVGSYSTIANAIRYAVDNGAHIINLSLGGPSHSQALLEAVKYAYDKGVLLIAAAGNDGKEFISYPAAYDDYVLAVGAIRFDEELSYYSNYGSSIDIVAPGGDLKVDQNNDGYGDGILQQTIVPNNPRKFGYYFYQGTSMATPHVVGVAGLIRSLGISNPQQIKTILLNTAKDLGQPGFDKFYGYGRLDAQASIKEALRLLGNSSAMSNSENTSNDSNENFISKILVTNIYVSGFNAGKRARIGLKLENTSNDDINLLAKGAILDEDNLLVSWGDIGDIIFTIAGNRSKIVWFERLLIPENIEPQNYILKIILADDGGNTLEVFKNLAYEGSAHKINNFKNALSNSILTILNTRIENILTNSESVIKLLNKKI